MELMIDGELYKHDSHSHQLRFHKKFSERYKCDGCKISGDLNPFLKCPYENCTFYLHQVCYKSNLVPEIQHPLFRNCVFELCNESSPKDSDDHCEDVPYCDACGLDIEGLRYHCSPYDSHPHKNHDLHPTCAHRRQDMKSDIGVELKLKDKVKSKCLHCGKKYPVEECIQFTGWKWISKEKVLWDFPYCFTGRKICYHLKCMNEKLLQQSNGLYVP